MSEGILSYLQLDGVGSATQICLEPGKRLNLITGDNGLGKTFLDPDLNIQFLITTHSPLILAAAEPVFDQAHDRLFHLDYGDQAGTAVVLENQPAQSLVKSLL